MNTPAWRVHFDLDGVTFIDGRGVTMLLALRDRAIHNSQVVDLLRPSPCVRRILTICNLGSLLAPGPPCAAGLSERSHKRVTTKDLWNGSPRARPLPVDPVRRVEPLPTRQVDHF